MDSIFLWLMVGVAGLLLVAAVVAGWEYLRNSVRPQDEFTSATPRAVSIDLRLDRLTVQPAPAAPIPPAVLAPSDMDQRRATLDEVLSRMSQPAGVDQPDSPIYWAETTPMVAPGQLEPHNPPAAKRPHEIGASRQP